MNFGILAGNMAKAYQGGVDGVRQTRADEKQLDADAYDAKVRDANTALLPLKTQAATLQAEGQIAQSQDEAKLRPITSDTRLQAATAEQQLMPGKVKAATAAQQDAELTSGLHRMETLEKGQEFVLGLIGKRLTSGDDDGVLSALRESFASPMFPATNGLAKPARIEVLPAAPAGAVDIAKRPITGPAMKVTLEDGSAIFMNPTAALQAHQKNLEAQRMGNVKPVAAGAALVDFRTGKELYSNDNGYITDENGNTVKANGGRGGAGGIGKAGSAKAEKDAVQESLKFALDGNKDVTPEQRANAKVYADNAIKSGVVASPDEAAQVALQAALHPERITPKLNVQTGTWDDYYQDPKYAGGRNVHIAPNTTKADVLIKSMRPEDLRSNAGELLGAMGAPEQQAKFLRAAHDPAYRKDMEAAAQAQGADLATLRRKLDLLKLLPKPGDAGGPGVTPKAAPAGFGLGGAGYTPPADSPAGKAQAVRAQAASQAQARADRTGQAQQALSQQFQRDAQALAPLELVRKYDGQRGQLPTQDAAALRAAEQKL